MKWGQIRKNKDIGIDSFVSSNMLSRVKKVADYLGKEDSRRPFVLSVLSRAKSGQELSQRQLSYFESIEEICLLREKATLTPPAFDKGLWRDRFLVDKSTISMGDW